MGDNVLQNEPECLVHLRRFLWSRGGDILTPARTWENGDGELLAIGYSDVGQDGPAGVGRQQYTIHGHNFDGVRDVGVMGEHFIGHPNDVWLTGCCAAAAAAAIHPMLLV